MKSKNQGSLLAQITAAPKAAKKRDVNSKDDDIVVPEEIFTHRENIRSLESEKEQEAQVKSDSTKRKSNVVESYSDEDNSQEFLHSNSLNSGDKDKSQPNLAMKADKKSEPMNRTSTKMLVGPSTPIKAPTDDSTANNSVSRPMVRHSGLGSAQQNRRALQQRAITAGVITKPQPKGIIQPSPIAEEKEQKKEQNIEKNTNYDQTITKKSIQNEDLIKKISEPIRRRLVVNLPTGDFETRRVQVITALDMVDQDVIEASQNVKQIHDSLIQLSRDSRAISEKSMDLTQTSEAVLSKVNVMADWIDGLEKVGSGLKIQLIEWIVKFVSFLSSLLLLIYQTIRKANPLALLRNKVKKKQPLTGGDDENS